MTGELKYIIFNTNMGWVGILGSAKGLLRTTLPQHSAQEARQLLGDGVNNAVWSHNLFNGLVERFKTYFSGGKMAFPDELDLSETGGSTSGRTGSSQKPPTYYYPLSPGINH